MLPSPVPVARDGSWVPGQQLSQRGVTHQLGRAWDPEACGHAGPAWREGVSRPRRAGWGSGSSRHVAYAESGRRAEGPQVGGTRQVTGRWVFRRLSVELDGDVGVGREREPLASAHWARELKF